MNFKACIFVFVSLLALSCSRNDVREVDIPYDIVYEVMAKSSTKADSGISNDYPADMPFSVWAYALPDSEKWLTDSGKARLVMDGVKSEHISARQWRPENGRKWEPVGENMSFFAAAPHGRAAFDRERGVCIDNYSLGEQLSLMYVDGVVDQDKKQTHGIVPLTFVPALAHVSFYASMSLPEGYGITIKKLSLTDLCEEGDFCSKPVPTWDTKGEPHTVLFFSGEKEISEERSIITDRLPMIPQITETELTVLCDIFNGQTLLPNQELKTSIKMNWQSSKHCSYTLKVTHNLALTAEKDPN